MDSSNNSMDHQISLADGTQLDGADEALQALGVMLEKALIIDEKDKSQPTPKPQAG